MNKFPEFVSALVMECMGGYQIKPTIDENEVVIDSELLKLSTYLNKCEVVYERNKVMAEDTLTTALKNGVVFFFHHNHVCTWYSGKKVFEINLPLAENAIWLATVVLSIDKLHYGKDHKI